MASRVSASSVDYMELPSARKDADCNHVEVKGGISSQLGCCNDFGYKPGQPLQFRCGTCGHFVPLQQNEQARAFYGG